MRHSALTAGLLVLLGGCATTPRNPHLSAHVQDAGYPGRWTTERGWMTISCKGFLAMDVEPSRLEESSDLLGALFEKKNPTYKISPGSPIIDLQEKFLKVDLGFITKEIQIESPPHPSGKTGSSEMTIEGRTYYREAPQNCEDPHA